MYADSSNPPPLQVLGDALGIVPIVTLQACRSFIGSTVRLTTLTTR